MHMTTPSRRLLLAAFAAVLITGGCAKKQAQSEMPSAKAETGQNARMLVAGSPEQTEARVYADANGLVWAPLEETAHLLNLDLRGEHGSFTLGNTDAAYSFKIGETAALEGEQPKTLPQAPESRAGKPYMTIQSLSALIGTPFRWDAASGQIAVDPIDDDALAKEPAAPERMKSLALGAGNKQELIRFAERFQGTPYQFSAGPYNSTHKFDCSSFTQYVFGHFGVSLPRGSRQQAKVGQTVGINQLQAGDLMFFYTPGRYASNRIVGHVGIYEGSGKVIHTYGRPGVTVTDFNAYWQNRFLFGKRVS